MQLFADSRDDGTYVAVEGALDELMEVLAVKKDKLWQIYHEAKPPFQVPSPSFSLCLELWKDLSQLSLSPSLSVLLQGIALSPLLTSITYRARWNEQGLDLGREKLQGLSFSGVDQAQLGVLEKIFEKLGIGKVDGCGQVTVSPRGFLGLQRVYSYYVPTSYAPLLSHFHHVLFEDPSWGFKPPEADEDEMEEIHVDRTLNVVGSGAQHKTLFKEWRLVSSHTYLSLIQTLFWILLLGKTAISLDLPYETFWMLALPLPPTVQDLLSHLQRVFGHDRFAEQPDFVIDTGCGDGHLLHCIYEYVREHTPRGKVLEEYLSVKQHLGFVLFS